MIQEEFNGFCMELADSVPGVSGGTVEGRKETGRDLQELPGEPLERHH